MDRKELKKTIRNLSGRFRLFTASRPRRAVLAAVFAGVVFLILNAGFFLAEAGYYRLKAERAVATPAPSAETPDPAPSEEYVSLVADEVRIASVGIHAPIVYVDVINEAQFQEALQHGAVHYPLTALPGRPGNAYVFGHSSDFLWRQNPFAHVFAALPHTKVGDTIEITDHAGTIFLYEVTSTFIVSPTDTRVLDQGDGSESLLTLQTSYPFGTALSRFIVRAKLMVESP